MKCPNCTNTYDFGNKCPHCNVDAVLYKRTVRLSERLYNQGLEKIKSLDFTNGVELLRKSIAIDKSNITARNLLGLALFEVGHVGDSLMEWVISVSLQSEDNPAEAYIERVNKNTRALEKLNESIVMFNNALTHIKHKSDDLAIIQLKRATENNPRFVDALNLLTLCYLIQNDKERAIATAERVISIDTQNPIALNYLSILSPNSKSARSTIIAPIKFAPKTQESVGPYKSSLSINNKKSGNSHILEVLTFILGAASVAAIFYFLLFPQLQRNHESEIEELNQLAAQVEETHREEIVHLRTVNAGLQATIEGHELIINLFEQTAELQERIDLVDNAYWLLQGEQLQEAVDILDNLDTTGMGFITLGRIETIREQAYPHLATMHFLEGEAAFNASDFYKALVDLELAKRFMSDEMTPQRRDFMLMLGTIYYDNGRYEEALELLTSLQEHFPNHRPQTVAGMIRNIEEDLQN